MKKLKKWFRKDYQGEEIVTDLVHIDNSWDVTKEWIGNSVINNQISNKACVIGNGISRKRFPLNTVLGHFGGLLAREKLQTYGCNALYREHAPDFLVVSGDDYGIVTEVANNQTCAVSCTGSGEYFLRGVVAYDVSCLMEYKGMSLQEACHEVIHHRLKSIGGDGGLIAIDIQGNITMPFNTAGMYRAAKNNLDYEEISIYS